jgi:CubicO group peptidase (beta-lactamase class C family)
MTDSAISQAAPALDAISERARARHRIPGIAAGIVRGDSLEWTRGYGKADLASGRAPDQRTLSRVASITKTFTALAIMQLRDEGLLTLEDPLVLHIPEFSAARPTAGNTEDVTLKRLLTHRSGLTTEPPLPGWDALRFPSAREVIDAMPQVSVVIPPDSAFKYSNFAFGLLGEVIARLTGRPYVQHVAEHILRPLGMSGSGFELTPAIKAGLATGYSPAEHQDQPVVAPYAHMSGLASAGQLMSNVEDLTKWVSFQFRTSGGLRDPARGQVVNAASLEEMHRPVYIEPDWSAGQAIGWRAVRAGDRVYHGHGGGIHGFGSYVAFHKPSGTGAIVLANLWPSTAASEVAHALLSAVLDADAEAARRAAPAVLLAPLAAPAHLVPYLGRYRADAGIPVNVEYRGGALRLVNPDPAGYTLHAPAVLEETERSGMFTVRGGRGSGELAEFASGPDGRAASFSLGGFVFRRQS